MDRKQIKDFIREVLGPNTPIEDQPQWVSLCCPLSPWTHERGRDRHPSAGISVKDKGGTSIFHCYTCHKKGPLPWLLRQLERYTGEDWSTLAGAIENGEFFAGSVPQWGEAPEADLLPQPIDRERYFGLYDSAACHPYVRGRGVSKAAARRMELLHDPGDGDPERIMFPVYDRGRNLYGFTGRAVSPRVNPRIKDYFGLPKRLLLLGSHLILPDDEYVILVEGLFDYARLVTQDQPAMAFMSSTLTLAQAEIVKDIGKPVYFFHDNDIAGEDARERAKELLWRHVPVMKVRYPSEPTVETPEGDLRPPEDPGELDANQVQKMLDEARLA